MAELVWDEAAERYFETGVDHGVLYHKVAGEYTNGEAWNGLTAVTAQPSGAESNKQYADNIEYLNLMSVEQFGATVECFMAPRGFDQYDGVARTANGLRISMQKRLEFGMSWRSKKGNAEDEDLGYVIHFAYGCKASPAEKAYNTVNDTPEPATFSWTLSTTPIPVAGRKPTAYCSVDSTDPSIDPANLAALEAILYGDAVNPARLPTPDEIDSILGTGVLTATPANPAYDSGTDTLTIPNIVGVEYLINGVVQAPGPVVLTQDTIVTARPADGYTFTGLYVDRWFIDWS